MADDTNQPLIENSVKPKAVITPGEVRRRRLVGAAVFAGVIVALGLFGWWYTGTYLASPEVKTRSADQQNAFSRALELADQAADIRDPAVKANQLSTAGELMDQAMDHRRSLDYYQRAQAVVSKAKLGEEVGMNFDKQIAEQYAKLGDKAKARQHYDAAIAFFEKDDSQSQTVKEEIAAMKTKRDQL